MFVVFTLNAYINLNYISRSRKDATIDRTMLGRDAEPPLFSGCLLEGSLAWYHRVVFASSMMFAGGVVGSVVGAVVGAAIDKSGVVSLLAGAGVGAIFTLGWVMSAGLKDTALLLVAKRSDSNSHAPFFSKIAFSEQLIIVGVVATTLTGIMPTIATNPLDRSALADTMTVVHSFGVLFGVVLMVLGASYRTVTFFRLLLPTPPAGHRAGRWNIMPCTWVKNVLTIGYPEWAAGTAVDALILTIFSAALVILIIYMSNAHPLVDRAHFCINYKNEVECLALDLDIGALDLAPWPCVWANNSVSPCINPNCDSNYNSAEMIAEFWVLTM